MAHSVCSQSVADRRVRRVAVEHAVVDLVGEDRRCLRRLGDAHQRLDDLARIDRAGGVVRIDDDERLAARADQARDLVGVGDERRLGTARVVDRLAAGDDHRGGPQRIVRRRQEHLVAGLEQRLHRHEDQLGDAVAHEHVVGGDAGDAARLRVHDHRLARREDALLMAVALGLRRGSRAAPGAASRAGESRTPPGCRCSA